MRNLNIAFLFLITWCCYGHASSVNSQSWNNLLQRYVHVAQGGSITTVDYAGMATEARTLHTYLQSTSLVTAHEFNGWSTQDQLAFLINVYNAWTVDLVLSRYPNLHSIKDLGSLFVSPWGKAFIPLLGRTVSLDDIEQGLIRGSSRYHEPRVHFALNCASQGCPPLRPEAYEGTRLSQQLNDQAIKFLRDRQRNRLQGNILQVSSIFKWYGDDFSHGWQGIYSLSGFLASEASALGLTPTQAQKLRSGSITIDFLPYNWQLNTFR